MHFVYLFLLLSVVCVGLWRVAVLSKLFRGDVERANIRRELGILLVVFIALGVLVALRTFGFL
jgi:hypothetical protein